MTNQLQILDLEECQNGSIDLSISQRIYYSCKDGFPKLLLATIKDTENRDIALTQLAKQEFCVEEHQILSPLMLATMNGHYEVVHILLTQLRPDLEWTGSVKSDGNLIEQATALWVAAAFGHLNIVKLLVNFGADVNHGTRNLSTPLRAACFNGRIDIIRYLVNNGADINHTNIYNNTCLMIAAYKGLDDVVEYLLEKGSPPDNQARCGATALHYAAECGHVDVCATLLKFGATLKRNEYGMSPVLCAAERTREHAVQLFLDTPELLTREEKIDALELMGASFANDKDNYSLVKAFQFLVTGMELRFEDPDHIVSKPVFPTIPAYEHWYECQTMQDLLAIRYNHNSLHMESLTIRERILGRNCPDVATSIVFRGAVCADNGRFDRCESLWMHAMELRRENQLPIQRDLLRFAQLFSQMLSINVTVRFPSVLSVLSSCVNELALNKVRIDNPRSDESVEVLAEEYEMNVVTVLYLLTIITKLMKNPSTCITEENLCEVHRTVYKLNQMSVRLRDDQSLLHLAVNGVTPVDDFHTDDICRFPCVDTVKLLLGCGASISMRDGDRNTPLHTLCFTLQTSAGRILDDKVKTTAKELTKIFVEAGIHLDAVNNDGLKASEVCIEKTLAAFIKSCEARAISLQCLAARCIALHRIPYTNTLPERLQSFVQLHCSDKLP